VAFLTREVIAEKPVVDIERAMFKDLSAMQKRLGTRDAYFVAVRALPLKGGKKVSLLIVAPMKDDVDEWYEHFHASKPKLLAQGTCSFAKGVDKQIVLELKKITGANRKMVVEAVAKGLVKETRYTVKDDQVRPAPDHHGSEDESEERG